MKKTINILISVTALAIAGPVFADTSSQFDYHADRQEKREAFAALMSERQKSYLESRNLDREVSKSNRRAVLQRASNQSDRKDLRLKLIKDQKAKRLSKRLDYREQVKGQRRLHREKMKSDRQKHRQQRRLEKQANRQKHRQQRRLEKQADRLNRKKEGNLSDKAIQAAQQEELGSIVRQL